jgi:hypothetical protein
MAVKMQLHLRAIINRGTRLPLNCGLGTRMATSFDSLKLLMMPVLTQRNHVAGSKAPLTDTPMGLRLLRR